MKAVFVLIAIILLSGLGAGIRRRRRLLTGTTRRQARRFWRRHTRF